MVHTLLEANSALQEQMDDASPDVLEERKAEACRLTGVANELFTKWTENPAMDAELQKYQEVNQQQEMREELLTDLRKLEMRAGETVFSSWLGDRVSALLGPGEQLGPVQRRLLKVPRAIEMMEKQMNETALEQEQRLNGGIAYLQNFKKALGASRSAEVDASNPAAVRFDEAIARMSENVGTVEKLFLDQPASPSAQMEALSKQMTGSFCSILPFLHEAGGGVDDCEVKEEAGGLLYESECPSS